MNIQPNIGKTFKIITIITIIITIVLFAWGLTHQSSEPQIFGRYSVGYVILLLVLLAVPSLLIWTLRKGSQKLIGAVVNAYLLIFSFVFTLGAVELGLRWFNPWGIEFFHILPYHMQGMVDHPELGYTHPKSISYDLGKTQVSLNSQGLRDEEVPYQKPVDERRILVLGDSVTFGWGVDQHETFSARMEPRLQKLTGERWQVVNSGVNGYNTAQEAMYLSIEGLRYEPDIVIVVFVNNDVDPVFDPNQTTWRRYPSWPSSLPDLLNRALNLSYLYQSSKLFGRMHSDAKQDKRAQSITEHPGWKESFYALTKIAKLCESKGVELLVAKSSDSTDSDFFQLLNASNIEVISLDPAWKEVEEGQQHVSRIDPHPSAAVHDRFAERLVNELEVRGWLGEEGL